MVAGHDIGGGVAQHLMLANKVEVPRLAVVNGIMYDSWPVPGVARFRDPAVAAATTRDDVLAARRVSVVKALGRPASEAEIAEYLDPWTDPRVARSWLALAGAADNRYTQEMLPALLQSRTPKLLVWGEDDPFQTVDYAERYAREIPETRLVRIKSAGHIPMENDPKAVAGALAEFFAAEREGGGTNEGCDPRRLPERRAAACRLVGRPAPRRDHCVQRPRRRSLGSGRAAAAVRRGMRHARTHAAYKGDPAAAAEPEADSFDRTAKRLHRQPDRGRSRHRGHRDGLPFHSHHRVHLVADPGEHAGPRPGSRIAEGGGWQTGLGSNLRGKASAWSGWATSEERSRASASRSG